MTDLELCAAVPTLMLAPFAIAYIIRHLFSR
jgi:hypothetical protein